MNTQRIAFLNDCVRTTFMMGKVIITSGVLALPDGTRPRAVEAVQKFKDFNENNDPYGEHDYGSVEVDGHRVLWKFDYYDKDIEYGSPDPADTEVTTRVLTIMLAEEY